MDWNRPAETDPILGGGGILPAIDGRLDDAAVMFDGSTAFSNIPVNAKRLTNSGALSSWNGSAWAAIALAISSGGTGATTAAAARDNLGVLSSDEVNTALALKADVTDVDAALALKADVTDVDAALALKANVADVNIATTLVTLGGGFLGTDNVRISRAGGVVSITAQGVIAFSGTPWTVLSAVVVPLGWRPSADIQAVYYITSGDFTSITVKTSGELEFNSKDIATDAFVGKTSTIVPFSITYAIA